MAGLKGGAKRKKCEAFRAAGTREKNKARRIERDARRKKPLTCSHGSRHLSHVDGRCKRCWAEGKKRDKAGTRSA